MAHRTADIEVIKGEILPVAIDITALLLVGETVTSVAATIAEETTGAVVTDGIQGTPSVTGTQLDVTIDGRELVATNRYELKALLTIAAEAKVLATVTRVYCV